MFERILGNEPIKAYLRKALAEERLPHALLFAGLDGVGKSLFAKELAAELIRDRSRIEAESHPDFHVIRPEGKSGLHAIETLKSLIDDVHAAPFEAPAKVFLIHDAHRMQPVAESALLKTLEEPSPDTVIILLTSALSEILPTIASRCSTLRFQPLSEKEIGSLLLAKEMPEELAKLAHGSAGRAFEAARWAPLEASLMRLLSVRESYPNLASALELLEKELENEDPVKENGAVTQVFSSILMWHRDQVARAFGAPLFFPDAPQATYPLPPLSKVERAVDEARLAISRNMRLSVCLEKILAL